VDPITFAHIPCICPDPSPSAWTTSLCANRICFHADGFCVCAENLLCRWFILLGFILGCYSASKSRTFQGRVSAFESTCVRVTALSTSCKVICKGNERYYGKCLFGAVVSFLSRLSKASIEATTTIGPPPMFDPLKLFTRAF
jgi:hypothetical protein